MIRVYDDAGNVIQTHEHKKASFCAMFVLLPNFSYLTVEWMTARRDSENPLTLKRP